jgi:hypothetical protein
MRIREVIVESVGAEDANAYVTNTDATADTPLTLEAAAASIDPPRELLFTFDGDSTAVTFTIVGKDRRGTDQTEILVGGNAEALITKGVYSSITSITPDVTDAGTFEIGFAARGVSPWFIMNTTRAMDTPPFGVAECLDGGDGTVVGQIEYTIENASRKPNAQCQVTNSPTALTGVPGDSVEMSFCAYWRIVNLADTGTLKVAVLRPSF